MVNFADCVSKVQCRNLVTNTPTKDGIRALLKATTSVNKTSQNGFKLGGVPTLVQDQIMYSMGAKQKGWVQKFYDKYGFRSGAKAEQELLRYMKSSKFEPCGIPVGTKEMFNSFMGKSQAPKLLTENPKVIAANVKNIAKAHEVPVDTFVKTVKK